VGVLTVVAGPNGAAKSTLTQTLEFEGGPENVLDPYTIAGRISPFDPHRARVAAGRQILLRLDDCMVNGVSFVIETTLASKRTLETMQAAKSLGFRVDLVYIGLDTFERCVLRVQERVLQGGHDVADDDVRRRYIRSLANLRLAVQIADRAIVYDNSENEHRKMIEIQHGVPTWNAPKQPPWVTAIRNTLSG
jgi:predicted ABC-type ATPase